MNIEQTQIHALAAGVFFEPFGVIMTLVTGFMGNYQFIPGVVEFLDQFNGMLDAFSLDDAGGL